MCRTKVPDDDDEKRLSYSSPAPLVTAQIRIGRELKDNGIAARRLREPRQDTTRFAELV